MAPFGEEKILVKFSIWSVSFIIFFVMGIGGLLLNLKGITEDVHIKEYAGKKAAIDTYVWLHKGSYSCSTELCQGLPTDK